MVLYNHVESAHGTRTLWKLLRRGSAFGFMKLLSLVITLGLLVIPGLALAGSIDELKMEGTFQGNGEGLLDLQIVAVDFDTHRFGVALQTGTRKGCSGDVRGVAKAKDATTIILIKPNESGRLCNVVFKFSKDFQNVSTSVSDCSYYHGASCGFDGALKRKVPVN